MSTFKYWSSPIFTQVRAAVTAVDVTVDVALDVTEVDAVLVSDEV